MSRIQEIAKRSNQWMSQFNDNVIRIIESNEGLMLNLNKSQMLNSLTAKDSPLIHARTGSAKLSKAYAKRTGKSKPNLFNTGEFQDSMFMTLPTEKEYIISSDDTKVNFLQGNYGKIFGVAPSNQDKAKAVNDSAIINNYLKTVFQ